MTDVCSLPRIVVSWWSRSSVTVRPLTSESSVLIVPWSTLNRFTRPTYGSTIVLNTNAAGGPSATRRRRPLLGDEVREPVDADELGRAAAQHGEDARLGDALRERVLELVDLDLLVAEVALHEVVVGDDDALDERVVDRVLLGLHLGRDRPAVAAARSRRRSLPRR